MKRYEYVTLGGARSSGMVFEDVLFRVALANDFFCENLEHRKIIDKYAQRGFRYIGYIPVDIDDNGKLLKIDLIFETDVE